LSEVSRATSVTVSDVGLLPARVVAEVAAWIELVPSLSGTLRAVKKRVAHTSLPGLARKALLEQNASDLMRDPLVYLNSGRYPFLAAGNVVGQQVQEEERNAKIR